jgi:hypothetical protein
LTNELPFFFQNIRVWIKFYLDQIVERDVFKGKRKSGSDALRTAVSISIPLATCAKLQEFCTCTINCFDPNVFSDRKKSFREQPQLFSELL